MSWPILFIKSSSHLDLSTLKTIKNESSEKFFLNKFKKKIYNYIERRKVEAFDEEDMTKKEYINIMNKLHKIKNHIRLDVHNITECRAKFICYFGVNEYKKHVKG